MGSRGSDIVISLNGIELPMNKYVLSVAVSGWHAMYIRIILKTSNVGIVSATNNKIYRKK